MPELGRPTPDDLLGDEPRRPRKKRRRSRRVDYAEFSRPSTPPPSRLCPHTTKVMAASACSQCRGAAARRVLPSALLLEPGT